MARTTSGVARHRKHLAVLKKAKGYRGGRSKLYRTAMETGLRGEVYATRDRRKKKGEFRRLWITRISAAVRAHDLSYSRFMSGLRKADIQLDRKTLSELAIHNPEAFAEVVSKAKAAIQVA